MNHRICQVLVDVMIMPFLPLELERLIFEMAALQDTGHDSRVRIILVAKRVYEWIRPIIYRVRVIIDTEARTRSTNRNWRNAKTFEVAPFARHLLAMVDRDSCAIDLLSTFRNVENLALWGRYSISPKILKQMNDLPLRSLSLYMRIHLDEAIEYCPALRNITHFEMLSFGGSSWSDYKALVGFPKLTHLSFRMPSYMKDEVVLDLLKHCPSLRVVVYQLYRASVGEPEDDGDRISVCSILRDEPRFLVLRNQMPATDYVMEWERSANGRFGFWELADKIVEGRKGKLFKDNSTFIFLRGTWMKGLSDDGMRWYEAWS